MLQQGVASYQDLRARSSPLPVGTAPSASSSSFRAHSAGSGTLAKRWDKSLSVESQNRGASTLKAFATVKAPGRAISLGTGRPAGQFYPWDSMVLSSGTDPSSKYDGRPRNGANGSNSALALTSSMSCSRGDAVFDLDVALNYGSAAGSPQLLRFLTEHIEMIHSPPYRDWETCLTCGTTAALEMLLRMFCDRGHWIIAEEYTYSGTIEAVKPLGVNILGIKMDDFGLIPEDLDQKLRAWDTSSSATHAKPSILYTIPSGQNPTGKTQTEERRRAIYRVAEEHDLIILEDDPYYLLQLGCPGTAFAPLTPEAFLGLLPSSYLSIDVSGRVLRLDSASKILAPGLRCGWLTGCSQLIAKFLHHTEFSTASPSGPSQVMLYKLLDEKWGHTGFVTWLSSLSFQYRQRLDTLVDACKLHLPGRGLCRWTVPACGMFLWMRIDWIRHPVAVKSCVGYHELRQSFLDVEDRIFSRAMAHGVQISKGSWFAVGEPSTENMYFRLTFVAAPDDALAPAVERLGSALKAEFPIKNRFESNSL